MLYEIVIDEYAKLNDFKLDKLARMNFITGEQGVGLTSILNYIEIHSTNVVRVRHGKEMLSKDELSLEMLELAIELGIVKDEFFPPFGGTQRIIRILSSLVYAPAKSIIIIDNIESGINFKILSKLLKIVNRYSVNKSLQVFSTFMGLDLLISLTELWRDKIITDDSDVALIDVCDTKLAGKKSYTYHISALERYESIDMGWDIRR